MSDIDNQEVPLTAFTGPDFPDPSPHEAMFFYNMIKNMNNQPDINWEGVATDSGFKNAAVAKKRFYQIKQKLGLDSRSTRVSKGPRKPRGCKAASDGLDANEKPCKVTKRRKAGTPAIRDRTPLPTKRHGECTAALDSGSDAQTLPCDIDGGFPGCISVGFLKTEDDSNDHDDGI